MKTLIDFFVALAFGFVFCICGVLQIRRRKTGFQDTINSFERWTAFLTKNTWFSLATAVPMLALGALFAAASFVCFFTSQPPTWAIKCLIGRHYGLTMFAGLTGLVIGVAVAMDYKKAFKDHIRACESYIEWMRRHPGWALVYGVVLELLGICLLIMAMFCLSPWQNQ